VTVAPATTGLIDRDELLAALDRAAARLVTVISAPAGSGKTCLLRAWATRPDRPRLAVVQVNRDEHDAQAFWLAVLRAVRQATDASGRAEPPVGTPDPNARAVADRVLAEVAEAGGDLTLVIDDLHELKSAEALAQLAGLLSSLPSGVHAILATRRDLRLDLHRLRLAGELADIRAADLRFSDQETRRLLDAAGVRLSDVGLGVLQRRTEGWAAGLRLAVLSLAGRPDPERFVAEFSGTDRTVAEYLLAEMLDRQPDDVRQLLLRTSLLDRVNGELADLLTDHPGSERSLLDLEDANAFVVSLDPQRTWFRYHHLFADLLRLELRRTLPEEVPALHRRAAGWFLQHGEVVDAIRHTQAAGDWSAASRLLADHSFGLTLDGQAQTIKALLRAFPPGADGDSSELAIAHATTDLAQGRLDEAAAHLAVAEARTGTTPSARRRRHQVAIASLKVSLARRRGSLAGVLEQAAFLTSPVTGQSDEDIALDNDLRAVGLMNLGIIEAWSLGTQDAERHLLEGAALARENGHPYLEVACLAQLAFASKIHRLATTRRRCSDAIARAEQLGWGAEPILAPAFVVGAGAMAWTGDFDGAQRSLERATRALRSDSGPGIRLLLHIGEGMLHAGRGHLHEAVAAFAAAERLRSQLQGSHVLANQVTGWLLVTQARLGRTGEARAALASLDHDRANAGEIRNGRAAVALADGEPAAALAVLTDVLDGTSPVIGYLTVVEAHLLGARAHRELGDRRAANRAVESALSLAEPDGVVLPFAITGARQLLEDLPRHETAHTALLGDILDVLRGSSLPARDDTLLAAEELSPTELRVLRYLPTNLSRPEIAGELSVSVNTVNTHIRNIYAKLQAPNRSAAVERARRLRLLAAGRGR
jgi:LuxR family transcriptional regulator, maltose regulon positive regulatory protein